jgi:PPM family protein phosphatase
VSEVIVRVSGRTDVGRARDHNEDALLIADLSLGEALLPDYATRRAVRGRGMLFMVADGLGGAAAGEVASQMAVQTVLRELLGSLAATPRTDPPSFAAALKAATEAANTQIYRHAQGTPDLRGMGTTATAAGMLGDSLFIVQVGDSRAYLVRDGRAEQITKDQSLMQRLIEAGELTVEEAERSERRNIILQALGPEPAVRIDLTSQRVRRGDTLVLCTDGLSGLVRPDEIAAVVTAEADPGAACQHLIDRANENGGPDNITVIVARFDGSGLRIAAHDDRVGWEEFPSPAAESPQEFSAAMSRGVASHSPGGAPKPGVDSVETPTTAGRSRRRLAVAILALLLLAAAMVAARVLWGEEARQLVPAEGAASLDRKDGTRGVYAPVAQL